MSDLIHTEITANGIDFHCLTAGDPTAPLALCLHGFPDSAHTWRHLLPELADRGFHAVAPFMRGYAPTSLDPDSIYQTGALGMDANAIHDVLGASDTAVIIGHDWGALASYAAVGIEPDRWNRIVGASVLPGPVNAQGFFRYEQIKMSWYMFFQLNQLADMVVPSENYDYIRHLWNEWSPGYDETADLAHFVDAMATPDHLAAALGYYRQTLQFELQHPDLADANAAALAMPTIPLLYLHGANDGCMLSDRAEEVTPLLPTDDSRVEVVADAGHFLHLERPGVVNDLILDFVTS